ncbi:MAG: DUF1501 domain-containing protein [Phycisphaera sp.]|nr:DUF1501 domain-containing protein [Phycisphaera sp.]
MDTKHPRIEYLANQTRRHFLRDTSMGLGAAALAAMTGVATPARARAAMLPRNPMAPKNPQYPAKAKRVIYLHMTGSPPNLDMYDYKPELVRHSGEDCPQSYLEGKRFAFTSGTPKLLGTPRTFAQHGQSGAWLSDALPNLATVADDICFIHSMNTDQFNHAPAELLVYTGSPRPGRPSMGAWATYGLGTENENLPGFVVLISSGTQPNGGKNSFGSGFMPSVYQGVQCRSKGDPVLYVSNPDGMDRPTRRESLDALRDLNQMQAEAFGHPETLTRIAQYELAYRMQTSVPEVMDIAQEPKHVLEAYGAEPGGSSLANNCLLARRLVEKGVRFVQLFDWGWDFHGTGPQEGLRDGLTKKCATMDKPVTALINDLKQRGLLEDTLIIWGGEFGRTPFREGRTSKSKVLGRDHYPDCYTMWMAGGGCNAGTSYGQTDEFGFGIAQDKVHVHDLQATILHLLGFDHEKLTYHFQGRDYRLTDVHGQIVKALVS